MHRNRKLLRINALAPRNRLPQAFADPRAFPHIPHHRTAHSLTGTVNGAFDFLRDLHIADSFTGLAGNGFL